MTPRYLFLTKGVGRHREKPVSFELALRDADIAQYNLVKVTSIFPPGCEIVPIEEGLKRLTPGEIVFCVMSENSTDRAHLPIAASIGIAVPQDKDRYGYLLEHQSSGQAAEDAGDYAESLAAEMVLTTFGERANSGEQGDHRDLIARTMNVTQTAEGDRDGVWTTVVVAAVFVP